MGDQIAFRTETAPRLSRVRADRSQIEQIVLNLALNARDAMPRGGQLTIRAENVRLEPEPGERGTDARPAAYVALSVSDTGSGMDSATQARMFEPFFTTKARGTGLGLYTVHHIIQESHGTIAVTSEPGAGTRIVIQLPAVAWPLTPVATEGVVASPRGSETLLVVDDEDAVRALLVDLLRGLGYFVLVAENAAAALERLGSTARKLDLLLTDIVMPGASGWELAADVLVRQPKCRVLYMSGHAIGGDAHASPKIVPGELLHKPFTKEALATRVRELLDRPV